MNKPVDQLRALRETFLADRRNAVAQTLAEPSSVGLLAGDFIQLQSFLDAIEAAIAHERHLARPPGSWPARPSEMNTRG